MKCRAHEWCCLPGLLHEDERERLEVELLVGHLAQQPASAVLGQDGQLHEVEVHFLQLQRQLGRQLIGAALGRRRFRRWLVVRAPGDHFEGRQHLDEVQVLLVGVDRGGGVVGRVPDAVRRLVWLTFRQNKLLP